MGGHKYSRTRTPPLLHSRYQDWPLTGWKACCTVPASGMIPWGASAGVMCLCTSNCLPLDWPLKVHSSPYSSFFLLLLDEKNVIPGFSQLWDKRGVMAARRLSLRAPVHLLLALHNLIIYLCWNGEGKWRRI